MTQKRQLGYTSLSLSVRTKRKLKELKKDIRRKRRTDSEKLSWNEFFEDVVIPRLKKKGGF